MSAEYILSFTGPEIDAKLNSIDDLAAKSDIPANTSELTNDSGFITGFVEQSLTDEQKTQARENIGLADADSERLRGITSIQIEYGRYNNASYYLARIPRYTVDGKRIKPKIAITSEDGTVSGTKVSALTFAKREGSIFTLNAGLFNTSTMKPQGQTIIDGVSVTNSPMTDDMGTAIADDECYPLCIDENGDLSSPYERSVDTSTMIADGIIYAVTAWGQFIDNFTKSDVSKFNEVVHAGAYVRQCIGQYQNGDYFVCTVDGIKGVISENEAGMTYDTLAELLISKGVKFAYSLDGGGSAETVIGDRQINPIFEGEAGRSVPTVLYFTTDDYPEVQNCDGVYWLYGYSAGEIGDNCIRLYGLANNRLTAYSKTETGVDPFVVYGSEDTVLDAYPMRIPDGTSKVSISVPTDYVHGIIFWKIGDTISKLLDYGWNSNVAEYSLVDYSDATHITVNIKRTDNASIDSSVDTSDFSIIFESVETQDSIAYSLSEAITFDGVDDYIDTGIALMDEARDFTILLDMECTDQSVTQCAVFHCMSGPLLYPGIAYMNAYSYATSFLMGYMVDNEPAHSNQTQILWRTTRRVAIVYRAGIPVLMKFTKTDGSVNTVTLNPDPVFTAVSQTLLLGASRATTGEPYRYWAGTLNDFQILDYAMTETDVDVYLSE